MHIAHENEFNFIYPPAGLSKYILFYNIVFPENNLFHKHYTLLPHGCGTLSIGFDGQTLHSELWGSALTPTVLGTEPNRYQVLLLIQFLPFGLYQITGQNQAEFADKRIALIDIDPTLYSALQEALESSVSVLDLARSCNCILHRRMERQIVSDSLLFAAQTISNSHGQLKIREVAKETGYSERQLVRLFQSQVGMSPKMFARLARFNHAIKNINLSPHILGKIAQQSGYFDQAHLDKDFKIFSGITPESYIKKMSEIYYDTTVIFSKIK